MNGKHASSSSDTVKPKKAFIQTNTIFNYFDSTKAITKPPVEVAKQPSISSYFTKTETNRDGKPENKPETKLEPGQIVIPKEDLSIVQKTSNFKIQKRTQTSLISNLLIKQPSNITKKEVEPSKVSLVDLLPKMNNSTRKCPFYKRIEGTKICVDAFSYGEIEECTAYFLSHYHYDHFIGLKKDFCNLMLCSQITANLVIKNIKVDVKFIRVLEMNKFLNVYEGDGSIQVALIDANHCPGSVMFLFKLNKLKKYILHTGDFRASDDLINNSIFSAISLDIIYLDTTYLDSYYTFLPQSKIVQLGVQVAKNEIRAQPNTLIICGTYTIGKERVFTAIAQSLSLKVYVTRDKKNVIDCLEDAELSGMITQDPKETNLHVIQMGKLNLKDLQEHADNFKGYANVIAFKPSGWTHNSSTQNGLSIEKKSKNITIYGLEYSEHSSFEELRNCISTLKPRKIIPTVNCGSKEKRDKMQAYFDEWQQDYSTK